jgi:uncharacterized protein (DUF983 family)
LSARAAQCPNCGAEILFSAGTSLVTVCKQCRAAVARKGVALENIGIVAELVPTSSPFRVGMASRGSKAFRPFRIIGRLQLSTGEGTWDEWHVAFADGGYAWLAEAQGGFWMMLPIKAPRVPEWEQLSPGQPLPLGAYGSFTVTEVRQATYVSAEGDLPFVAPPGALFRYADLSSADGSLGTLDYGDDPGLDGFFVGRKVELAELGIEGLTAWRERKAGAKAQALNCPSCGGALQLKDPASTVRIACTYCGSLLGSKDKEAEGPPSKFEVLEKLSAVPFRPTLPIGSEGTLNGHPYAALGAVLKKTSSGGTDYFWVEYLLKETKSEAYHWLAESNGHWTLLEPVATGAVTDGPRFAAYQDRRYRVFSRNPAVVEAVLGEFYWAIRKGETTQAADYIAPPRMLSKEQAKSEVNWTEGRYLPKAELEAGLKLKEPLPVPTGVGACQPWPHEGTARFWWRSAFLLSGLAILVFLLVLVRDPRKVVFDKTFDLVDAKQSVYAERGTMPPKGDWQAQSSSKSIADRAAAEAAAAAGRVLLSEPFETGKNTNLEATIWAPTQNTWIGVGTDLISETTGEARSFYLLSDRYSGVDGGESWSEGSQSRSVFVSQVPPGKYVLRLEPESDAGKAPASFRVRLRSGVPRIWQLVVTLFLLMLGPAWLGFSRMAFEGRRWSESDFTSAGTVREDGGDSDDGGDE